MIETSSPTLPTLLHSCARAATAAELRFRVGYKNSRPRVSRWVALDPGGARAMRRAAPAAAAGARFFEFAGPHVAADLGAMPVDARVRDASGAESLLSAELAGADLAVILSAADVGPETTALVGGVCSAHGVTAAGLVVASGEAARLAVKALRPHVSILVVTPDEDYVAEMLSALRA